MRTQPAATQAGRHGRGGGKRHEHRSVANAAIEPHPHEGLHNLRIPGSPRGIERPDRAPVLGAGHGAAAAGPTAVSPGRVPLDAAPGPGGVAGGWSHDQDVRAVPVVEAQSRLGQGGRRAVGGREVPPEGVGWTVHGFPPSRGAHPVRTAHGWHRRHRGGC